MKIVITIIIVLVWFGIMAKLTDIWDNPYTSDSTKFFVVAGMIAASLGGIMLIKNIFKK